MVICTMKNIYQLNKLQFYYADKLALSLNQLNIQAGKTTALIGANGSGKSTLLSLLAFLQSPDLGELLFNGQQVKKGELTHYRRRVGFLAQKPFMLRGTVYDNINLALKIQGKKQRSEKIHRALKQLDIKHCANQRESENMAFDSGTDSQYYQGCDKKSDTPVRKTHANLKE